MAPPGNLYIVDNSEELSTGFHYLNEWCDLATSFDIATGFFEIGALLELDGQWQKLDKIRILMGGEVTYRTNKALLDAVRARAEDHLDASLEVDKNANPFLEGVEAVVEALVSGKIECRVYNKAKFHAKTYITHAKSDVIGSLALVGSSNFTRPGLGENVELNIQATSRGDVHELQVWFEDHWNDAEEITEDLLKVVRRHTEEFTPFDVYSRALHELFHGRDLSAEEWEQTQSKMFGELDLYQKEGYWALNKIARQHGGAMLCDGVGLGKTFVGLMLIERLILHENKRVLLFAPKAAREAVWNPHLDRYLSHVGGSSDLPGYSNLLVFNHTDLTRKGAWPEHLARNAKLADAIVIDESHHFRNRGTRGDIELPEMRSRYWHLRDLLDDPDRPKQLFMLTATPINNSMVDFKHQLELFARSDDHFAGTLGVPSLAGRVNEWTRKLRNKVGEDADIGAHIDEARYVTDDDPLFEKVVVQRSRSYARKSQIQETGSAAAFPVRKDPKVAVYSIRKTYGALLQKLIAAFDRANPLFSLAVYFPLNYYEGDPADIEDYNFAAGRQKQVVQLIRTVFLKRFESSVFAFETSCDHLVRRLLAFLDVHCETEPERARIDSWIRTHQEVLDWAADKQLGLWDNENAEDDVIPPEMLEAALEAKLNRPDYRVDDMIEETFSDLDVVIGFLEETKRITVANDDKLKKLTRMLKSKEFKGRKVLIFSEFADTVRYVSKHLQGQEIEGVESLDSASGKNRADVITRFSPYYNNSSSADIKAADKQEIQVLICTDVLSEGLNLQDSCRLINYDIHWNPVRLMQRIGRVDRRLNPETEAAIKADHPDQAADRGTIRYWNFLPPKELDPLLTLFERVTSKTLMISEVLGIEGKKLLSPDDDLQALKDFNVEYEGKESVVEAMRLEYQALLKEHPELEGRLNALPGGIFSGRQKPAKGSTGVFFCYRLPAWDTEAEAFTLEAGPVRWYLYDLVRHAARNGGCSNHPLTNGDILEEPRQIVDHIRSTPETPRVLTTGQETLVEIRGKVLRHIKNTYERAVGLPLDAPKPSLSCWMELNEGP